MYLHDMSYPGQEMTTGGVGYTCDGNDPCGQGNQYYPHVINSKYIQCGSGQICYEMDCAAGLQWDQTLLQCARTK